MFVTQRSRRRLRLTTTVFVLLVLTGISLLAWLSLRYQVSADWTSDGRHTLSEASVRLLAKLEGPVEITSYAREDDELRGRITSLVDRYRRNFSISPGNSDRPGLIRRAFVESSCRGDRPR
jgi:multidrug resistance efflux pump